MLRHAGKNSPAKTELQRPAKALMAQIFGADILSTGSPGSKVGSPLGKEVGTPPGSLRSPAVSHSNATPIASVGSRPDPLHCGSDDGSTQNCSPKPIPPASDQGACSGVSNTIDGAREPSDKAEDNGEVAEVDDAMNVAAQFAWPD